MSTFETSPELDWLMAWFSARGELPGSSREEQLTMNYFDAGLIDSFGVIELISDIEQEYAIEFSADKFLDRQFSTIGGLAAILSQMRAEKGRS